MKKLLLPLIFFTLTAHAAAVKVSLQDTQTQEKIGDILLTDTPHGLLITPSLQRLSPGMHGFHLHEQPNCADQGMAAGGHYDPAHTQKHLGPFDSGHQGDLPALYSDPQRQTTLPMLAPQLKVKDTLRHSLIIHVGADNYQDTPKPLGGGGNRIACGTIQP